MSVVDRSDFLVVPFVQWLLRPSIGVKSPKQIENSRLQFCSLSIQSNLAWWKHATLA
jgi:hypothetical protein